jgi:hypothetical protein
VSSSLLGAPLCSLVPIARGSHGENFVLLWTCDDGDIGVVPFLEASHLRPISTCDNSNGSWRCCPLTAVEEVHLVRVGGEVQRTHGGVTSSGLAWFSGDLGDG